MRDPITEVPERVYACCVSGCENTTPVGGAPCEYHYDQERNLVRERRASLWVTEPRGPACGMAWRVRRSAIVAIEQRNGVENTYVYLASDRRFCSGMPYAEFLKHWGFE